MVRANEAPRGFDINNARQAFVSSKRGGGGKGMVDAGLGIEPIGDGTNTNPDDGLGGDTNHHGDGDGDYDDHYDHGHHDNHYYFNTHYSYYTHYSSPYGWWYIYGDYNGDGYTDYVCTNGSYSIYWYGWAGSYWGASPWYGFYGLSAYNAYPWWYYSVSDRYRGVIYGSDGGLSDDPSYTSTPLDEGTMPDAVPLSAVEVARLEMSIGEPEIAVDAYRAHLSEFPNDWVAVRELGVAMIRVGDRGDGIALINYAYSMDPTLSRSALPMSVFEDSDSILRDVLLDAVGWGHRNPSSSAWLTVAVLMQAQGRDGPGLRMIDRAMGLGLDPVVADEMRSALARR